MGIKFSLKDFVIICIVISLLAITFFSSHRELSTSDEQTVFYSVQNLLETGDLKITNTLNVEYDTCVFAFCPASMKSRDESYPISFIGSIMFYYLMALLFGLNSFFFIPFIFAVFSVLVMYLILMELFHSRFYSTLGIFTLVSMPVFLKWSISFFNIIPIIFFLLFSFYFLIKNDIKYSLVFSGLFFSFALFLRLESIIFALPFLLYILIEKIDYKRILFFFSPIFLGLISILILNRIYFGSFFYFPMLYGLYYPCYEALLRSNEKFGFFSSLFRVLRYFTYGPDKFENIINHTKFLFNSNFAFPLISLSFLGFFPLFKNKKKIGIFIFGILLITLFFYGHRAFNYYGFGQENLHSSITRYMLFSYVLLVIPLVYLIKLFIHKQNKFIKLIFLVLVIGLMASNLFYFFNYPYYGLYNYNLVKDDAESIRHQLASTIPEDSVVLTTYLNDKYVYGFDYNVICYSRTALNEDLPINHYYKDVFNVIDKLKKSVYILKSKNEFDNNSFFESLNVRYKLKKISTIRGIDIYQIK